MGKYEGHEAIAVAERARRPKGARAASRAIADFEIDVGDITTVPGGGAARAARPEPDTVPERVTPVRLFGAHLHRLLALGLAEFTLVVAALYGALAMRFPATPLEELAESLGPLGPRAFVTAGVMVFCLGSMGLYQLHHRAAYSGVLARLLVAVALAQCALALVFYAVPALFLGRGVLAIAGGLSFVGLALTRYAFLRLVDEDFFKRRVLVWGTGPRAASIPNRLRRRADKRGFRILGYVRADGDPVQVPPGAVIHPGADILRQILRHRVEEIVVAMEDRRKNFPETLLRECRLRGIAVRDIVSFIERESGRVSVEMAHPSWLIFSEGFRCDALRLTSKRLFDIGAALLVLLLAWPLAVAAAIAIFLEDRGPILYRQVRTGQSGRPFDMLKFRSMSVNAEAQGTAVWAARNDPRVTRVGAFIRKVRIDELPQVINVLRGDMSFVGPRPERPSFVDSLSRTIPFYAERHFVKPGITGWAQVRFPYGSSEADAREKLGYDLYYVKNHSLLFDLMVLLRTVEIVLFRVGSR